MLNRCAWSFEHPEPGRDLLIAADGTVRLRSIDLVEDMACATAGPLGRPRRLSPGAAAQPRPAEPRRSRPISPATSRPIDTRLPSRPAAPGSSSRSGRRCAASPAAPRVLCRIARRIGPARGDARVCLANNANPIRSSSPATASIGADGSMTGFGGGIGRNRCCRHEGAGSPPACAGPSDAGIASHCP